MLSILSRICAVFLQAKRWIGRFALGRSVSSRLDDRNLGDVETALASMPLFVREAYLLRQVDQLDHMQIARTLGVSEREVRRLLRDAVRVLDRSWSDQRAGP